MNGNGSSRPPRDRSPAPDAVSITDAPTPLTDDLSGRARRYLIQMSTRVVCFLGAVVIDHPIRWVLLAGAIVLPYFAVVLANVGSDRGHDPGTFLSTPEPRALPAAGPVPGPGPRPGGPA